MTAGRCMTAVKLLGAPNRLACPSRFNVARKQPGPGELLRQTQAITWSSKRRSFTKAKPASSVTAPRQRPRRRPSPTSDAPAAMAFPETAHATVQRPTDPRAASCRCGRMASQHQKNQVVRGPNGRLRQRLAACGPHGLAPWCAPNTVAGWQAGGGPPRANSEKSGGSSSKSSVPPPPERGALVGTLPPPAAQQGAGR